MLVAVLAAACFCSGKNKQDTLKDKVLALYAVNQQNQQNQNELAIYGSGPRTSAQFEHGQIYGLQARPPSMVAPFSPYVAHGMRGSVSSGSSVHSQGSHGSRERASVSRERASVQMHNMGPGGVRLSQVGPRASYAPHY